MIQHSEPLIITRISCKRRFFHSQSRTLLASKSKLKPLPPSLDHPTPKEFYENHLKPRKPSVFPHLVHPSNSPFRRQNPYAWSSIETWSSPNQHGIETLDRMRNGDTETLLVLVEVGKPNRGYMEGQSDSEKVEGKRNGPSGWDSIQMPFGLFLDAFIAQRIPWSSDESQPVIGYMAQYDLLSSSPELSRQCPSLPHTSSGPKGELSNFRSNTWIGPKDTFTPIHRDPYHNIFVQVIGTKRFHFFPPECADLLNLSTRGTQQNTSKIPSEDFLLEERGDEDDISTLSSTAKSNLEKATNNPESYSCVLNPGDVFFLPRGWFHCVRSLSTSVSVNFWFN